MMEEAINQAIPRESIGSRPAAFSGGRRLQPFRITCETCRSRLKIRSADVIGQIHACPKCGSMVQVVPPAGWDPNSAALAAEQTSAPGDAALTLSTTASGIFPASALDDLSA